MSQQSALNRAAARRIREAVYALREGAEAFDSLATDMSTARAYDGEDDGEVFKVAQRVIADAHHDFGGSIARLVLAAEALLAGSER